MATNNVKNAILKAKIGDVIYEVMAKTDAANVYVDESTTLAAKLSTILADIATKATKTEMTEALAAKAEKTHTHAQGDIAGLTDLIATLATNAALTDAIDALRQEMLGDTPVEAYNTFTEMAAYIAEHKDVSDALAAAIGQKVSQADFDTLKGRVDALGTLAGKSEVAEDDLAADLKEKVNAASEGNHAHLNKDVLDGITEQNVADWNDAVSKEHVHDNKAVLDDITSGKVAAWDAAEQNAKNYADGLAGNYDAKGAAATAENNAKNYADGLAGNYDAVGSATTAENNANAYTDTAVAPKARVLFAASQPADLTDKDLWVQLV